MYCLRCGKDTHDERVFCESCLLLMEAYPVKPGTAIHLPERKKPAESKKQWKVIPQSELLLRAKRLNRWLTTIIVMLLAALGALVYFFVL